MVVSKVLPLFRSLALPLAFVLVAAFPLPACATPPELPEGGSAPVKNSQPTSQQSSLPAAGYEIPAWASLAILAGAESGPVLLVVAGVHGDEASGPLAARQLAAGPPPARGIIAILFNASPEALLAGQRWLPGWSDLNRAFPTTHEDESWVTGPDRSVVSASSARSAYAVSDPAYRRAEEILALVVSLGPALLLDLHESDHHWTEGDDPALVVPASSYSAELALALLELPGLEGFTFTGPPPAGSLVAAVDGLLGIPALLVEVPDALVVDARIAVQLAVVNAAMRVLGMIDSGVMECTEKSPE